MSLFNKLVVATLPAIPKSIVKVVAQRYIAGDKLSDAVRVTQQLMQKGACSTIDVLGEFVTTRERAVSETAAQSAVIDAIDQHKLNSYLSVKPTSLGLDVDKDFAYENLTSLVKKAKDKGLFVRMDMENTPYTDVTLEFYKRLRAAGYDNVGVVIQAYLKRSEADIRMLLEYAPSVRLCKGIYVESAEVAIKDPEAIRDNYKKLLNILLTANARVHIATHDEQLIVDAERQGAKHRPNGNDVEFQMLLGGREGRRDMLLKAGHTVRIYVPLVDEWYGYSTRRLKENPQVAGYVAKAFLTGK